MVFNQLLAVPNYYQSGTNGINRPYSSNFIQRAIKLLRYHLNPNFTYIINEVNIRSLVNVFNQLLVLPKFNRLGTKGISRSCECTLLIPFCLESCKDL